MSGPRPLEGIKVLDLSRVFAGPVAGRILSDLGADVVKVEPPDGDVTRTWGRKRAGLSTYFVQQNAGKRNICIDLTHPDGAALVAELADKADVVLENFRPGVLGRFGLDWAALSARNPRLVMVSISGFGQDGPESQRAAYASVAHAEMGLIARQKELGNDKLSDVSFSAADVISGLHGVIGLLAALRSRDLTGVGTHLDLSMLDTIGFSDDCIIFNLDGTRADPINGEVWDAPDGPICLPGGFKWVWRQLSTRCGLEDPAPPGVDLPTKLKMRHDATQAWFLAQPTRQALLDHLVHAGLAWGDVKGGAEVLASPTLIHRKSVVQIDDRDGATRPVFQSPYRYSHLDSGVAGPARHRGEDNIDVLTDWLGLTPAQAAERGANGVTLTDRE